MMAAETHQRPRQSQHRAFYERCNISGQLGEVYRHPAGLVFGRTLRDTSFEEVI
jgi:hypothetical protein